MATLFVSVPRASASQVVTPTHGCALTTANGHIFHPDGSVSVESDQVGHLSNVGAFTAHFSYLAVPTPTGLMLTGSGTVSVGHNDRLFLKASIVELGADFPFVLYGVLTITGGTGRYSGAKGALFISGIDEANLTDTIQIQGSIITPKSHGH